MRGKREQERQEHLRQEEEFEIKMSARKTREHRERAERSERWEKRSIERAQEKYNWQKRLTEADDTLVKKQEIREMERRLSSYTNSPPRPFTPHEGPDDVY
jgi:hypothetical protein